MGVHFGKENEGVKPVDRGLRTEDRGQRTEYGKQRAGAGKRGSEGSNNESSEFNIEDRSHSNRRFTRMNADSQSVAESGELKSKIGHA
jgi:hypothetical protein